MHNPALWTSLKDVTMWGTMLRKRYGSLSAVLTSLLPTNIAKRVICFIPCIQVAILCGWESSRTSLWCKKPYCICVGRNSFMISACRLTARKRSTLLKYLVGNNKPVLLCPSCTLTQQAADSESEMSVCSFLNCSIIFGKNESSASRGALSSPSTTGSTAPLLLQEEEKRWYSEEENTT